jgi:hypothetical protein
MGIARRAAKVSLAALAVIIVSAAGGGVWLNSRIQTPDYCANCHVMAPYYDSWKSSALLANTHAGSGFACQVCHPRTLKTAVIELAQTATGRYAVPIKDHRVKPEECLTCHGTYQDLAEFTKDLKGPDGFALGRNPHDSHWGKLDCGVCHKMHKPSAELCAGCHGFPAVTGPGWVKFPVAR